MRENPYSERRRQAARIWLTTTHGSRWPPKSFISVEGGMWSAFYRSVTRAISRARVASSNEDVTYSPSPSLC